MNVKNDNIDELVRRYMRIKRKRFFKRFKFKPKQK